MKYIITEHQYKLLLEQDDILRIPFVAFGNDWDVLQRFLERRGNPPYMIMDDLDLRDSEVKSLGNLTSVGGDLFLRGSKVETLGNLISVRGNLYLRGSEIKSLGNLTSVGGNLNLIGTKIESLGNLTSVGGNLDLYLTQLSRKHLNLSGDKIRSMVEVGGNVYL
jgi:hypothetical protein